jgi:hypothetical protein
MLHVSDPPEGSAQADGDAEHSVHVQDAQGTLIGNDGRQVNYFTYVGQQRSVGEVRPSTVIVPGEVESPYRG